jgi:NAD(P)-dependent dehydrogenase (short-subunit alcohol dehydrogenase family)
MESHTDPRTGPERISLGPLTRGENRDRHRRGIGLAIAEALAAPAATVIVTDLNTDREAKTITDKAGKAFGFAGNVADPASVEALVAFAEDRTGAQHLLVSNAGKSGPAVKTGDHRIDRYRRDPQWPLLRQRYAIPAMKRAGGGAIGKIASISGRQSQILMRCGPAGMGPPKAGPGQMPGRGSKGQS